MVLGKAEVLYALVDYKQFAQPNDAALQKSYNHF